MDTEINLYDFVGELCAEGAGKPSRKLEEYLRALWGLARGWEGDVIPVEKFAEWMADAFHAPVPPFDEGWGSIGADDWDEENNLPPRESWEKCILFQIADLRRMEEAGMFENEWLYMGK